MKKLIKGLIVFVLVVVLGSLMVLVGGWFMLRGTPAWYKNVLVSPEEREMAARNAEDMFTRMTNWAASARARHLRASAGNTTNPQASTVPTEASQPFQIQFTDQELNAFFDKWANFQGRREFFEQYVDDPRIVLRDNQLILAGNVKEMNTVVSMEFEPHVDDQGRIQMNLVHVLGGILPMPDALWAKPRARAQRALQSKLPEYQNAAAILPDGTANSAAVSAGMNKLLLAVLQRQSADPIIFVPYDLRNLNRTLPVKITAISIQNNVLTVTAEQLKPRERAELVDRLRAPYAADSVTATVR